MSTDIIYKLATREDYAEILSLYNSGFGANRSIKDIEWLYDDNPMGRGQLFIALIDNKVIGMQGIVRYQFRKGSKIINTYKSEDSLINKNYRGKGVYKTLYKMVFEYIDGDLIWGLTDKKQILERTGLPSQYRFILAASVNGIVTPSTFEGERKALMKSMLYSAKGIWSKLSKKRSHKTSKLKTNQLTKYETIEGFGKKLAEQHPNELIPLLTGKQLLWRLKNNPKVKDWKVYSIEDKDENIKALTLVSLNSKKCRWLSSYFLKDVDSDARSQHIIDVQNQLFGNGIKVIEQWIFDNSEQNKTNKKLMLSNGFQHIKNGLWVVNNGHMVDEKVDNILFSAQLGLD